MAEDINSSASFGQSNGDGEELPIIVAQRFLNIFRQLHIFSDEKRKVFNQMLLELSPDIKAMFSSLPGGTPLQEYMEDIEQESKGLEPLKHHSASKKKNILQEVAQENSLATGGAPVVGGNLVLGNDFARILADTLAQSNAKIISGLQGARPLTDGTSAGNSGSVKLVADESFTNTISQALSKALEDSEKKRLEDNQIISRSFLDLKDNLSKIVEQNSQIKIVSNGKDGDSTIIPFQIKKIVDDLVQAQSQFFEEMTKSQKEQLTDIISKTIKESQQVSTQALIESFKKINDDNVPMPITYTATSSQSSASIENVEQALKAQGKEFSSIISDVMKESQKHSAQTILETLESIKKNADINQSAQNTIKIEEIMRMQANLFRDIARAQNQEFSALISEALKESQRQSTQAFVNVISRLQNSAAPMAISVSPKDSNILPEQHPQVLSVQKEKQAKEETIQTPFIDKYLKDTSAEKSVEEKSQTEKAPVSEEKLSKATNNDGQNKPLKEEKITTEEPQKKKKKKKKNKKNKEISADKTTPENNKKTENNSSDNKKTQNVSEKEEKSHKISESLLRLVNASTSYVPSEEIKDTNSDNVWHWDEEENKEKNIADKFTEVDGQEGEDWEWEYEEVPEDAQLEDGQEWEWEWEYEEVPEGEQVEGEEGTDWTWEYSDDADNNQAPEIATRKVTTPESLIQNSEIMLTNKPKFILLGLEDESFKDPYIENNDFIG